MDAQSVSQLEKMAYGTATALFVCGLEDPEKWYEHYVELCDAADKGQEPDGFAAWQPFENSGLEEVLSQIDTVAASILQSYREVLSFAKAGLVEAAIECTLDSDMNALDLSFMVDRGAALEAAQLNTEAEDA